MSQCNVCYKTFASRQSLCNHRKRAHSTVPDVPPGLRKVTTEDKKEVNKVIDAMFQSPKKDRSPPAPKKVKVSKIASKIDTILNGEKGVRNTSGGKKTKIISDESDSDSEGSNDSNSDSKGMQNTSVRKKTKIISAESDSDSNDSDSGSERRPKDMKEQKSLLTDAFNKVYSSFDENDVEMRNDILKLLDALKTRGCVTKREYADIKSHLERRMHLNLYESIHSTIENMTKDNKNEVLELLRSMKDKDVGRLIALVKDYFEKEVELESVLLPARKLKDRLNALKIEIILKQIEKTRDRVKEIFTQLTSGTDKMDILNNLRSANLITDEQYEKLVIGPDTLPSISRIIQGKGMYLGRHWHR